MNDQLLAGSALAAAGITALVGGVVWLAAAALVAALPFVAVGLLFALGATRAAKSF